MSIDRIGTAANAQFVLAQMRAAENSMNVANQQVASGKLSLTYSGYAGKTASLEGARTAAARADADLSTAQAASQRLDLQNTLLSQLSDLANDVRSAISNAVATGNGSSLDTEMQGFYDRAVQILNAKDGDSYVFGGENDSQPPVTAATLSDLAALPSASAAFANGTSTKSVRIGQSQTVQTGMLASDLGGQLFSLFQSVTQFDQGASGPFGDQLTGPQSDFLTTNIKTSADVANGINVQMGTNGSRYQQVQDAMDQLNANATVSKTFVSNIEDVDMADAVSKLNLSQVAFQASLQVTAKLNQVTLLDYLPIT